MYTFNYPFMDGCKWGVSDWYEEFEDEMKKAIESDEPFDTKWMSCKKELESFRICRDEDGDIAVSVYEHMDDVKDLVYDALWDVFKSEQEILEDDMDEVCDSMYNCWDFRTESECSCDFSFKENSSLAEKIQQLKDALGEQIAITHDELKWSYNFCKETVKEYFVEKYGWEVKEK